MRFQSKRRIVGGALLINLCSGLALAFTMFHLPLTRIIGVTEPAPDDWALATVRWISSLAYISLGVSAALTGAWHARFTPRPRGLIAALAVGGGVLLTALGVFLHELWLLYLGYSVIAGCGLGVGLTTSGATLLQWLPEQRSAAIGIAVAAFVGGGSLAVPIADALTARFHSLASGGVWESLTVLGVAYLVAMTAGALLIGIPEEEDRGLSGRRLPNSGAESIES